MKVLVLGATGATGKHLVKILSESGHEVKAVVRSVSKILPDLIGADSVTFIEANVSELSVTEAADMAKDCDVVASCLGHNLSFKGIYGQPRKLVTDAVKLFSEAGKQNRPERPVKFILMSTVAILNHDLNEKRSPGEKIVFGLLRGILPPQIDNEQAAEYLRTQIGQADSNIEWCAVRPEGLTNDENVSEYKLSETHVSSPVFDSGKTSRINVGHFMASLAENETLWNEWKGRMPVVYNTEQ
jgi:nucleoside-diphosphate-sugar epimerase